MRVAVTGAGGFLGSYVVEELNGRGHSVQSYQGRRLGDLTRFENAVRVGYRTDVVVHCAAYVGGIGLNIEHPGELFYKNVLMGTNVIEGARLQGVKRVVVIGTACEYPHVVRIPTSEDELWEGYPTFETASYAMAKKALLVMGQAYMEQYDIKVDHVIPSNLYGPHDHFDTETGHVIPAMIAKFSAAQAARKNEVELWGTGLATRDFLHVTDAARGIVDVMEKGTDGEPVNLGSGRETRISTLADIISNHYDGISPRFTGEVSDGAPRRLLNTSRAWAQLGWLPRVNLEEGIAGTVAWYEDWDL